MADLETLVNIDYLVNGQKANASNLNNPLEDLTANITTLNLGKAPKDSPTFTGTVTLPKESYIDGYDLYKVSYLANISTDVSALLNLKAPIYNPTFTGVVTGNFKGSLDGTAQTASSALKLLTPIKINDVEFDGSKDIYIEKRMANSIDSSNIVNIATQGFGDTVHVIGSTDITSLGQGVKGNVRTLIFNTSILIKHNGTSLILPGEENIRTEQGDVGIFISENSSSPYWRCIGYMPKAISVNELRYLDGLTGNIQSQLDSAKVSINNKADVAYVDTKLALKADIAYVDTNLDLKADVAYVDNELSRKADVAYVDNELSRKADIISPTLGGIPRAPIPASTSNDNQIATTSFVTSKVSATAFVITYGTNFSIAGYSNIVGNFSDANNYFDVFPPIGKTMSKLKAFIPSIAYIYFNGGVNGDDSLRCIYSAMSDRIRVYVQNTEQRSSPAANWIAFWN